VTSAACRGKAVAVVVGGGIVMVARATARVAAGGATAATPVRAMIVAETPATAAETREAAATSAAAAADKGDRMAARDRTGPDRTTIVAGTTRAMRIAVVDRTTAIDREGLGGKP